MNSTIFKFKKINQGVGETMMECRFTSESNCITMNENRTEGLEKKRDDLSSFILTGFCKTNEKRTEKQKPLYLINLFLIGVWIGNSETVYYC